ncbi:MAG TPA: SBBP repeat-containing protein [Chitinophagaceae bacterium]|nr:SBBP repeat-containing protein [Chitinophagaceae bacterium]
MKKLLILSAFIFLTVQASAQWPVRYNAFNKNDQGRLVIVDAFNNVYVTGRSQDKKGNEDYATIKYSPSGQELWVARYNGTGNGYDVPHGLAIDGDGNVYVTGASLGSGTSYDYATVKYNSAGAKQWAVRYDDITHRADLAKDIKVDAAGNVYVTGYVDGETVLVNGNACVTIKYNSSGVLQWVDRYDGVTSAEDANSLDLDGNGNVYITGQSGGLLTIKYNDLGTTVQREWVRTHGSSGNGRKVVIDGNGDVVVSGWSYTTLKYDPAGNLLWSASYSGPENSEGLWDMALDGSGNIYTTGYSDGTDGSADYLTVKYNSSGTEEWVARYSGADADLDLARAIAVDNSGNVYVTGMTQPSNGSRTETSDFLTIKYNSSGQQDWLARYDRAKSADGAFAIALDGLGNLYVTGESAAKTTGFDYATLQYSQTMITRSAITSPLPETASTFQLKNFPNPFSQNTNIEFRLPQEEKFKLSVYDLLGREVATLVNENKAAGTHLVNFNSKKLLPGTYFYRIQAGEIVESRKLVILK